MNDKLTAEELEELEELAERLDNLYTRLEGSQFLFALDIGNEQYHQSLQNDLEQAAILGIQINRPMEHCGCLFEALNGTERPPIDYIIRARSEVNNLAIAIRQIAVDEHKAANGLLGILEGKKLFGHVDAVENQIEDVETTGPFEFEYDRAIKLIGVGAKRERLANEIYNKCSPKQKKQLCKDYSGKNGAIAKLTKDIDNLRLKRKKDVDSR